MLNCDIEDAGGHEPNVSDLFEQTFHVFTSEARQEIYANLNDSLTSTFVSDFHYLRCDTGGQERILQGKSR